MKAILRDLLFESRYYMDLASDTNDKATKKKYLELAEKARSHYITLYAIHLYRTIPRLISSNKVLRMQTVALIESETDNLN